MYTCMTEGIEGSRESTAAIENVIFLHGFLSSSSFWTETVFPNLSDHQSNNYRLFAVDLLGFGRSPKPRDKLYTLRDHFEMIEKSVISQFDLKSFHLVAHSMGCIIALALAAKHPSIVRSITLVAPVSPNIWTSICTVHIAPVVVVVVVVKPQKGKSTGGEKYHPLLLILYRKGPMPLKPLTV